MTLHGKGPLVRVYEDGSVTIDDWEIGMGREIIYPQGADLTPDWRPISSAPHDGSPVRLGWLEGGRLRRERDSRWVVVDDVMYWEGGGFPTHWRPLM